MNDHNIDQTAKVNTDKLIYRADPDDFYSPSLHITADGALGIDVGGRVIVKPIKEWHAMAWHGEDDLK